MARKSSTLTTLFSTGLLAAAISTSGCAWFAGYDGVFLEAEDVSLDIPDSQFRADGPQGDLYLTITQTASDTNSWVTTVVETSGYVVEFLSNHHETGVDGTWRVYGPFDDSAGRDISWLVRISGTDEDTSFEFLVAPRGTTDKGAFELMADGNLTVDDDLRYGNMHIDFDTIEKYPELDVTTLWSFSGDINIDFERNVESGEKTIEIQYMDFHADRTGYLDDDKFESNETYEFHKAADGSGSFHLALMGEWDTWPYQWSGPMQERMQLDMVWTKDAMGRAYGSITEIDGVGDMKHGDVSLDECFEPGGYLTYRSLSELYANEVPSYNFGDPSSCVVEQP